MAEGQFEPSPASWEGGPGSSFARRGEGLEQTFQKDSRRGESDEVRFHLSLLTDSFFARRRHPCCWRRCSCIARGSSRGQSCASGLPFIVST
jgi:hypothetical protein